MRYPFEPKSTKNLLPGQFWGVPLRSGRFAAGVILAHATRQGKRDTRLICIGLLDWVGAAPPTCEDLAHCAVVEHGFAHVRSIQRHGRFVLGRMDRDWGLEPELNFDRLAAAGISVWGLSVVYYRAEYRRGDQTWVKQQLAAQWAALPGAKAPLGKPSKPTPVSGSA